MVFFKDVEELKEKIEKIVGFNPTDSYKILHVGFSVGPLFSYIYNKKINKSYINKKIHSRKENRKENGRGPVYLPANVGIFLENFMPVLEKSGSTINPTPINSNQKQTQENSDSVSESYKSPTRSPEEDKKSANKLIDE